MKRIQLEVMYAANGSCDSHRFECDSAMRTLSVNGTAIHFVNGVDLRNNRAIRNAQYHTCIYILSYEAGEIS
jgi:hypothetical protein